MADIASAYVELATIRDPSLNRVRETARYAAQHLLPRDEQFDWTKNNYSNRVYSSLPAIGAMNLPQRISGLIMPPGIPWLQFILKPELLFDPGIDQEQLVASQQALFHLENVCLGMFHSAHGLPTGAVARRGAAVDVGHSHRPGAEAQVRAMLEQLIVQSDVAVSLRDDYTLRLWRRESYVVERDAGQSMLRLITHERLRRQNLTDEQMRLANLQDTDFSDSPQMQHQTGHAAGKTDLLTEVKYDPQKGEKPWRMRQEVNKHIIYERRDDMPQVWSVAHNIPAEGSYGYGLFEALLWSIRTMDELERSLNDMMAQASDHRYAIDAGSSIKADALSAENRGRTITGAKVRDGKVQDIASIPGPDIAQYNMLTDGIERHRVQLSRALMVESETVRQAERVTAQEIQRNSELVQESLGGILTTLQDQFLVPLARQLRAQVIRHKLVEEGDTLNAISDPHITSGLTAIQRLREAENILNVAQVVGAIGAPERLNVSNMMDIYMRKLGMHEPGLFVSDEELAAQQEQQLAQQAAANVAQEAGSAMIQGGQA